MFRHREDSIAELNQAKGQMAEIQESLDLAFDGIIELDEKIASLIEAQNGGAEDGGN